MSHPASLAAAARHHTVSDAYGSSAEPNEALDAMAAARKLQRAAKAAERKARVEELKNLGNEAFKMKDWRLAHDLYHQAIKAAGEEGTTRRKDALIPWLNITQVYMKTNMPDLAEQAATAALTIDPRNVKARFRRGVARRDLGILQGAISDFTAALKIAPNLTEARDALEDAKAQLQRVQGRRYSTADESYDEDPLSSDDDSGDDYSHKGNGTPCRDYNHLRCTRGASCPYSHAPDDSAERDALGRNVCNGFIIGRCDRGSDCSFAHSIAYLEPATPKGRRPKFWENEASLRETTKLWDMWKGQQAQRGAGHGRNGRRA